MTAELIRWKQKRDAAVAEMTPELKVKYEEILAEWLSLQRNSVTAGWKIGKVAAEITDNEGAFGADAMKQVFSALPSGLQPNRVWSLRSLYNRYPDEKKFLELVNLRDVNGTPLSLSHLVVIATVDDAGKRKDLLKRALEQGMTVRQIQDASQDPSRDMSSTGRGPAPPKTIEDGLMAIRRLTTRVTKSCPDWEKAVFGPLDKATKRKTPPDSKTMATLSRTVSEVRKAREDLGRIDEHLAAVCQGFDFDPEQVLEELEAKRLETASRLGTKRRAAAKKATKKTATKKAAGQPTKKATKKTAAAKAPKPAAKKKPATKKKAADKIAAAKGKRAPKTELPEAS